MEAAPGLPKRRTCAALGDPQLWEWREESVASEQRKGKRDALASSQGQDEAVRRSEGGSQR